jgi:AraC-like DNA-binding protein
MTAIEVSKLNNAPASAFRPLPYFAKIVCEPKWRWLERDLPLANYDLFYVWSGEGELKLDNRAYALRKGTCFLFRRGDFTSAEHNPQHPLVLTYAHFEVDAALEQVPDVHRVLDSPMEFEQLLARYVRLLLLKPFAAEVEAQLILQQLMIILLRHDRESGQTSPFNAPRSLVEAIQETANYVAQNSSHVHTVEELAARAGISKRYFSTKFKQIIGQSVQSYLIDVRLTRAEHLLRYSGLNVTEVANALGYSDIYFFSRQFKEHKGISPSKLR